MTTSSSPLWKITAQANKIARSLKAAERGEQTGAIDPAGKIAEARARESIKVGIAMDDKIITIEIAWATIRATSRAGLAAYIVEQMRGTRSTIQ